MNKFLIFFLFLNISMISVLQARVHYQTSSNNSELSEIQVSFEQESKCVETLKEKRSMLARRNKAVLVHEKCWYDRSFGVYRGKLAFHKYL